MRYSKVSWIVFLLLSVGGLGLYAQNGLGVTTEISLEQGLSDRTVTDIAKDHFGYIWIATRNGLNRYDGLEIVNYDRRPGSTTHISNKDIQKILCRKDGSLLIQYDANRRFIDVLGTSSTQAQKLFLNKENGILDRVHRLILDGRSGELYVLLGSRDSNLVVQQLNDSLRFDSLFTFQDFQYRPAYNYNMLMLDRGLVLLTDTKQGVILANTEGEIQSIYSYDSLGIISDPGLTEILYQDRQGRIWISFENTPGLWEFNEAAGYFTPFQLEETPQHYQNIWEDALGNVIIQAKQNLQGSSSLFLVSADDGVQNFELLTRQEQNITEIFSDDFERLLFVGTTNGVKKITRTKKRVSAFLNSKTDGKGVNIRGIVALPDNSVIFNDHQNDWYSLDQERQTVDRIEIDLPVDEKVKYCDCSRDLVYDPDGLIWGVRYSEQNKTELLSMSIYDRTFDLVQFPQKIEGLTLGRGNRLWLISSDKKTESRLSYFDKTERAFHHYFLSDGRNPLKGYEPTTLFESSTGAMLIGTTNGLLLLEKDNQPKEFQFSETNYFGISSNLIYTIMEDSKHRIWIGTDGGVNVFSPSEGDEFVYYDTRDGLAGNNVYGILEDENGSMWFSTDNGLSYFNTDLRSFRNFNTADGFSQLEFSRFSFIKDKTGNFLLGGINGLNLFNPNELLERNLDAPILLTEVSFYNKIIGGIVDNQHNLQNIKEVVLPASNRFFHCAFALADYAYPQENQYKYLLEGRDDDWNWLGTQNEIGFNNLPSGNYVLRISGMDRNLNVSSRDFALPIKVNQYFYKKSWFIALCVSLILFTIYLFHRISLKQVIEMERLRTKISSDLHDDVGGLLSGLAMQTELLEYTASEKDKPKLKRISDMSRNAMAQMRDVIWATDARKDRFEDLLVRMKEYAAEILFSGGITYQFHLKGIPGEKKLPVQVRQNLYLIFKEAITNVAKHSNATRTDIYLTREGSYLEMIITDDGQGLTGNGQTSSLNGSGLKNMEMRAKNINADFAITKDNGFKISLKMKSAI